MKEVTEETKLKIYGLCRDYLGGKWTEVDQSDLIITTVPDGNVNKLFFCFLPDQIDYEPNKVVVRFNTNSEELKQFRNETHVTTINVIVSEKAIAPKLLAVFEDGMIHQKIGGRYFMNNDDRIDSRVKKLATKLADFHSLRMPLPKARNPMFDGMVDENNPFTKPFRDAYNDGVVRKLIEEVDCKLHKQVNVFDEMRWVISIISDLKSPMVFSHNDFNRKNILIKESKNSTEDSVFLIDFDWTNYNYRGIDLGRYFSSYAQSEPEFGYGDFPSDDEMSVFLKAYINRMTEIFGESYAKQDKNSFETLVKESKIFAMNTYLSQNLFFVFTITGEQNDEKKRQYIKTAEKMYELYFKLKKRVLREYSDIKENN